MSKNSKLSRNTRTVAAKGRISRQPTVTLINKKKKLQKHLNKYPNDNSAKKALASI